MFSLKAFLVMFSVRKTTSQFIEEAKLVHKNTYGYSLVDYKTAHTKVKIVCNLHGVFEQSPSGHLSGRGCRKCANLKKGDYGRLNTDDFIKRSIETHGNKYDYTLSEYKSAKTKIKIKCPIHGVFNQAPYLHIKGNGCPTCAFVFLSNLNSHTKEDFIRKAKEIHGDIYDYSLVYYKNTNTKVIITCKLHGDWEQKPSNHLHKKGCPRCAGKNKNTDIVIEEFKNIHGDRYDYSLVDYVRNDKKVKIICKKHGLFEQIPNSHLQGYGCSLCGDNIVSAYAKNNPTGWSATNWELKSKSSKSFDSFKVYIIKCWNESELFYKIGRTFLKTNLRFQSKNEMPYNYEILNEFIFDNARECFNRENELKRLNKLNKYLPNISFGGMYECFSEYPALE